MGAVIQGLKTGDEFWCLASSCTCVPVTFACTGVRRCHDLGELNQSSENYSFWPRRSLITCKMITNDSDLY